MARSIFITGASSGIGRALALELGKRGYGLALSARRADELERLKAEITDQYAPPVVAVRALDVTDYVDVYTAVDQLAEATGGLDIICANAGVALGEKIGRLDFEKTRQTVEVNLLGAMATLDAGAAYFLKTGGGHLAGISSVAAFRGMPRSSAYSASKAGLAVYMEAMRAELHGKNIDISVFYPGFIDTPLNNMLPSRPFLITAEKGAQIIANLIEKKVKSSTVPVFPWNIAGWLLKLLPTGVIARM